MDLPAPPEAPRRRAAALALTLWVLFVEAWFRGPLLGPWLGPRAAAAFGLAFLLSVLLGLRASRERFRVPDRALAALVALAFLVATLVRLPALLAPGSLVSSDSAVAGIIAQELREGRLPPPIYAPGFPYEGTLKPQLTALMGVLFPSLGTPLLYTLASHLFYLLWIFGVTALAWRAGGRIAAFGAGLFMAVSPRFLTAFSLNNVGQYPEVSALGTLSFALVAGGAGLLAPGFLLGLAVWQQLVGVYFVVVFALAALLTPALRRGRALAGGLIGLAAGSYPLWIWNASNAWATFDFFQRGGRSPSDRLVGLPERLEKTVTVSFPKMFGLTDAGMPEAPAAALGLCLPALVFWLVWTRRDEIRAQRARSPALLVGLLLVVTVLMFAASKFSHRGAQRPRYLIPVYTAVAVAAGTGLRDLARRSRLAAAAAAVAVLGLNAAGLGPWLMGRAPAQARDRAVIDTLLGLGVRTGYGGFWFAPKYTFLAEGRLVLSGELGPDVSWVHAGHAALVRAAGPDAFILADGDLADAFTSRLAALGSRYERTPVGGYTVFHHLSPRLALEDVEGYDRGSTETPAPPDDESPDRSGMSLSDSFH